MRRNMKAGKSNAGMQKCMNAGMRRNKKGGINDQ
jgi:hypothetical protein